MLNSQLVSNHRDEFRIRRFRFADVNRIAKQVADAVDVATCPSHFNGMTDGTFDARWRCFELFGNRWIQKSASLNGQRDAKFSVNIREIVCRYSDKDFAALSEHLA
jgi:hypothetical protein